MIADVLLITQVETTCTREDSLLDLTAADAIVIVVGLALFVLILRWGLRPGQWLDRAAGDLDWMIERIKGLWR